MNARRLQFNRFVWAALASWLTVAAATPLEAQCTGVRAGRIGLIAATYGAGEAAAIALRHDDWWNTPRSAFHFSWGGSPSKGQDGLLHAAIAYQASQVAALAWEWACTSRTAAAWLGAALAVAVGLPKEIGDGLHDGFSGTDMLATAGGAILPALHRTLAPSRALTLKVFYWPSAEYRNKVGRLPEIENDYAGQRFYLSLNPSRAAARPGGWPAWLGIAAGHGVPYWVSVPPRDDWYLTLDLEFGKLPIRAPWWRKVAAVLDQGHLPLPGVRIRAGTLRGGVF